MNELNSNNQESLSSAIKKIIVFFDLFDYPLTVFEIYTYLEDKYSLDDIFSALKSLETVFENKHDFYFLKDRLQLVKLRQARYNYSVRKLKIAKRYAQIFGFFPFVKVVTLANVIGAHNMRDEGDIDFFIITTRGRIWLTRLFCTGLTKILNKRPTKNNKREKICLSFYISEDSLNLDDLKIKPTDPYFEYWLKTMILLYNKDRVYENFLKANNLRAEQINNQIVGSSCKLLGHYSENIQNCIFFDYLEKIFKKWQLKIMPIALKKIRVDSQGKFINDKILKLYWRDRNAEILDKFNYELNRIF